MTSETIRNRVWISGRVQGVGYRISTLREANRLGASGWVRNLPDGRVEAVFEGSPDAVAAIVAWCRRGPVAAEVASVDARSEPPERLQGFEIR